MQQDHVDRLSLGRRASIVGMATNLLLAVGKGVAGLLVGSVSIVADAVNNLMDLVSSSVSLIGFKLARKPADTGHPYGHGRFEYLAGLGVAVLVVVAGTDLARESVQRILHPVLVVYTPLALGILAISVVTKLCLAHYYRRVGTAIDSKTLFATALDSRNDALATGAILVGALVSNAFHLPIDGPLGAAVALFVLWSGIQMLRDTVNPLLGSRPDPELVERVRTRILSYPGVLGTHDLMIHDYGPGHRFASAHVEMASEEDPLQTHAIIDQIERDLRRDEDLATILHYDPVETTDHGKKDGRTWIMDAVRSVDERLSVHDVRIAHEGNKTLVSFDCVRPEGIESSDAELRDSIEGAIRAIEQNASCSITFDTGYAPMQR